jgi:hypothetical protein
MTLFPFVVRALQDFMMLAGQETPKQTSISVSNNSAIDILYHTLTSGYSISYGKRED